MERKKTSMRWNKRWDNWWREKKRWHNKWRNWTTGLAVGVFVARGAERGPARGNVGETIWRYGKMCKDIGKFGMEGVWADGLWRRLQGQRKRDKIKERKQQKCLCETWGDLHWWLEDKQSTHWWHCYQREKVRKEMEADKNIREKYTVP